ncbi:VOC family protein [Chondromyces crocatus]|uniref:VOC domain-containing protein n=1 Tax=Chondromyces crocatus TaxID=52 RepID=A0A0K1EKB6_CHOCO|nr:VOC family protein [Chondromyces crocatus]AKT41306.1 uncharacterized protein CMC5_054740 [Chondromyces crocatus]
MTTRFFWYELRTTHTAAAQAFYATVLGLDAPAPSEDACLRLEGHLLGNISTLPERAAVQGAPPHWVGHLAVEDLEDSTATWTARGAQRLGPSRRGAHGGEVVFLRDPFGSVIGLTSGSTAETPPGLVWHELHTEDQRRASSTYAEHGGWQLTTSFSLGAELGSYQMFSWRADRLNVGGVVSSVRLPNVHPHWLFYFQVNDLELALSEVTAHGGYVHGTPREMPDGSRIVACEDPQRAAFGLKMSPGTTPSLSQ